MGQMFDKNQVYTFKSLDIDKTLSLTRDFISREFANEEVHDTISATLGDIKKDYSVAEIKDVFRTGKYSLIHLQISKRWGNGSELAIFIRQKPNEFSLFHRNPNPIEGRKLVESFIDELGLFDVYDHRLLKIKSKAERSYIEEALVCRNSGALRAAIIIGWTCVMNRIYSKIEKKYKAEFVKEMEARFATKKKFKIKPIKSLEDYQQFKDRDLIDVCKNLFLGKGLTNQLLHYLDMRNDCGHVRVWQPKESIVDAFFDEIFQNIF